jgi:hypothetical protein
VFARRPDHLHLHDRHGHQQSAILIQLRH